MDRNMSYLKHFHLKYNPFPVAPDTRNFFISQSIDRIITEITHGIETRKGFMILVGEVGLGKTTMGRRIVSLLQEKGVETSLILHTGVQGADLLKEINRDFKIRARSDALADHIRRLNTFLLKKNAEGKNCAIIIDDAQNLSIESLELIRMISNLETDAEKLVQVLLIGQPELKKKLASPQLRQLQSRVVIQQEVKPLDKHELKDYVFFKLNSAGNDGTTTVTNAGLRAIYKATKGNFRKVNILMDRCLYAAFVCDTTRISRRVVKKAIEDLQGKQLLFYRRPLTWAVGGAVVLCLAIGGYLSREVPFDLRNTTPMNIASAKTEEEVPIQVLNFLENYGLGAYAQSFFEGLRRGCLDTVAKKILQDTGMYLVQLNYVPDCVRRKFGVLAYPLGEMKQEKFLLFWRPQFLIERFYYGYKGPKISKLQQFLANLNFYRGAIDGIVGRNLMRAVVEFQKSMSLPVTGYPDPDTLFLVCNMNVEDRPVYGDNYTSTKTTG